MGWARGLTSCLAAKVDCRASTVTKVLYKRLELRVQDVSVAAVLIKYSEKVCCT